MIRRNQEITRGHVLAERIGLDTDWRCAQRVAEDHRYRLTAEPGDRCNLAFGREHEIAGLQSLDCTSPSGVRIIVPAIKQTAVNLSVVVALERRRHWYS